MAPLTINNVTVDPAKPGTTVIPKDAQNSRFILLKCKHRLSPNEVTQANGQKVEIMRLVEDTTYLCKYLPSDLTSLEKNLPFVDKAIVYLNEFVISPSLKKVLSEPEDPKALLTFTFLLHQSTTETGLDLLKAIQTLTKDVTLVDDSAHQLRARVPRSVVPAVAKIDYVEAIDLTKMIQLTTIKASGVLKANDGLKPNKIYQGENEIIAVADQGFDRGNPKDVHEAFKSRVLDVVDAGAKKAAEDRAAKAEIVLQDSIKAADAAAKAASTNPKDQKAKSEADDAKLMADAAKEGYTKLKNIALNPLQDLGGHGTHVAGCALGSASSPMFSSDPTCVKQMQSPAPKAKLFFQAIAPGENIIPNLDTLFVPPPTIPFKIHSNSWGARSVSSFQDQEPYTLAESFKVDEAMFKNRGLLIVWSVGNDGDKWQVLNNKPVYRQAGDLAAAKNALVVGATFSNRTMRSSNPLICVDGENPVKGDIIGADVCADFSSKGPTTNMRIKPDVVAPGVGILSALGRNVAQNTGAWDGAQGKGTNPDKRFTFDNGSSMAAPLVAGCAAALRQALMENGFTLASGALIKALIINGAVDLKGHSYKYIDIDDVKRELIMPAAPNPIQGYGRVDLERSLRSVVARPTDERGVFDIPTYHPSEASPAWTHRLTVPPGKPVLRVTLVYTDAPGEIIQDEINLRVDALDANGGIVDSRLPDAPPSAAMPYEDAKVAPLPVYGKSNVQKVTFKITQPTAVISVAALSIAPTSPGAFSIAYFFDAT